MTQLQRKVGKYTYQYSGYSVEVIAKRVNSSSYDELTPQYSVRARARPTDSNGEGGVTVKRKQPTRSEGVLRRLVSSVIDGESDEKVLRETVEEALREIDSEIESAHGPVNGPPSDQLDAQKVAEAAVRSWDSV